MSLNEKLMNMYREETGKEATYRSVGGSTHHFLDYVDWLEDRASKSSKVANDSASHNTEIPKFPKLSEVRAEVVRSMNKREKESFLRIVEATYDCISRKLR